MAMTRTAWERGHSFASLKDRPGRPVERANPGGQAGRAPRAAVFLDKDGTLIEDIPYNVDPDLIRLTDGAVDALRLLHAAGFVLIVVSNQSGVARGYFEEAALEAIERRLRAILEPAGIPLAGFYYCPHHPDGIVNAYAVECACRKPAAGLIQRAAHEHGVDLARSWMIGDILHDVEAGRRAGCRTILLDVGHETEWDLTPDRTPHLVAASLLEATHAVVGRVTVESGAAG